MQSLRVRLSDAPPPPPKGQPQLTGLTQPLLQRELILMIAVCGLSLAGFFLLESPALGGRLFFVLLLGFLGYYALGRRPMEALCLLVANLPILVSIRGVFIPYIGLAALLLFFTAYEIMVSKEAQRFWNRKALVWLVAGSFAYWWLSFLISGDRSNNFRALEMSLAAAAIFLLNWRRSYFATAMLGLAISTLALAIGMYPYGDRLGMGEIDGVGFGNPVNVGIPAAIVFLYTLAEGGKRLLLHNRPILRIVSYVVSGMVLLLSTSRGSWLVALFGMLVLLLLDFTSRKPILKALVGLGILVVVIAATPSGKSIEHYLDKSANSKNSMRSRTDGRYEQWVAFPQVIAASPLWGFGPGTSRATSLRFSGENILWHSLYLQVGAESGLLGLAMVFFLIGKVISDSITHRKVCGEVLPLLGVLSYIFFGFTVSGLDAFGGLLLGTGLTAGNFANIFMVRKGVVRQVEGGPPEICVS